MKKKDKKIIILIITNIFVVMSTILYCTIKALKLGNDLGVIIGFLFGISLLSFIMFLNLFLDLLHKDIIEKKKE